MAGTRAAAQMVTESPQAIQASGMWGLIVMRSFLYKVREARDIVDVQIAAGAALQDLDELEGLAQYEESLGA